MLLSTLLSTTVLGFDIAIASPPPPPGGVLLTLSIQRPNNPQHTPAVQWVHSLWTGVDNVLSDQIKCSDTVTLTNAKHAFSESLGEYAVLGALYFAKRVPTCLQQYHGGTWEKYEVGMLRGYACYASTLSFHVRMTTAYICIICLHVYCISLCFSSPSTRGLV